MYTSEVGSLNDLITYCEDWNESHVGDGLDWSIDERNKRIIIRFPNGDLCNAPSMVMSAIQDTEMYVDHLSVGSPAVIIKE